MCDSDLIPVTLENIVTPFLRIANEHETIWRERVAMIAIELEKKPRNQTSRDEKLS
jgi:hypothetical protein